MGAASPLRQEDMNALRSSPFLSPAWVLHAFMRSCCGLDFFSSAPEVTESVPATSDTATTIASTVLMCPASLNVEAEAQPQGEPAAPIVQATSGSLALPQGGSRSLSGEHSNGRASSGDKVTPLAQLTPPGVRGYCPCDLKGACPTRWTRPSIVRRTGHHCAGLSHRRVKMYAPSERRITLKQCSHHARENEHDTSTQCNRWAGKRSVPRDGRGTDGDGESAARKVSAWLASELDPGRES